MLKSGSRGSSGTTRHRVRRALVIAETALAVIVIVGAGLLLRTVHNLTIVDAGFDRARLVTFSITPPLPAGTADLHAAVVGIPSSARTRSYQRIVEQLRVLPGVEGASAMTALPLERPFLPNQTQIANADASVGDNGAGTPGRSIGIDYQRVMSGFFETMGIPILQGRGFAPTDAASPGWVAVVNETLANTYWSGRNPIGQRLRPGGDGGDRWFTVIGVAKDVKQTGVDRPVGPEAYVFVEQHATDTPATWVAFSPMTMHVVVRTRLPLTMLAPAIGRVVRDVDPAVPVARLREMDEVFAQSIERPRLLAQLLTVFSGLALVLAAIGTYGVLSYMVTARRREIGIRLALGANRAHVLRQVMTQGLTLAGMGVAVGLAGALGLNRLLSSLLFGVHPADVMTLAIVMPSIIGIAALACWLPAWRASRVNPTIVLRED
jgi:predicted permease